MGTKVPTKRLVTPAGTAVWPKLQQPETKFDPNGVWMTKLALEGKDAAWVESLDEWLNNTVVPYFHAENPKSKRFTVVSVGEEEIDDEGNETGRIIIKAKKRCLRQDGTPNQPPTIVDSAKQDITKTCPVIWGGSEIKLSVTARGYAMAALKQIGVTLFLNAVQVLDLVTGAGGADVFDVEEGGFVSEAAPAGDFDEEDDEQF